MKSILTGIVSLVKKFLVILRGISSYGIITLEVKFILGTLLAELQR